MAKKKKLKKRRGRKEVEDKIVQVRYGLRRSVWEEMANMKFYSPIGNKKIQREIDAALIKMGINLKK